MGTAKRKVYDAHSRVKWDWRRSGEQKPSTRLRRSMVYTRHSLGNGRRLANNRSAPCLRMLWHTADRCLLQTDTPLPCNWPIEKLNWIGWQKVRSACGGQAGLESIRSICVHFSGNVDWQVWPCQCLCSVTGETDQR